MSEKTIKLKIDGKNIITKEGKTILEAAKENGIYIPSLCYLDGLTSSAGCRLCLVEVKGFPRPIESCYQLATNGMEVTTQSSKLNEYRKTMIKLLLASGNHICSVCVANGNCELQDLANELGVDHVEFEREWSKIPVDFTHDFLVIDRNRCILCTRCIRVCSEVEGVHALDLRMRGQNSQIVIDLNVLWRNSISCTSCRKCAKVCPVGAIYIKGEPINKSRNKDVARFILSRRDQ